MCSIGERPYIGISIIQRKHSKFMPSNRVKLEELYLVT